MIKKVMAAGVPMLVILALGTGVAFAQGSVTLTNPLTCSDLNCAAGKVIQFAIDIAIPLTAIMALVGGFQMMTAAGNPEKFSKGRKTLIYAAVGFGVVLIAQGVTALIQSFLNG